MKTYAKKGFSLVELVVVIIIIGIVLSIASPLFIKRLHSQKITAGSKQVISHLHQARQKAIKEHKFYRLNFVHYENAYIMEKSDDQENWKSVQISGQDAEEQLIVRNSDSEKVDLSNLIYLPKSVRVSAPDSFVAFNNRGNLDVNSIPADLSLTITTDERKKISISVNIAGIPRITKEER